MKEMLILLSVFAGFIFLNKWLLPKLGIQG